MIMPIVDEGARKLVESELLRGVSFETNFLGDNLATQKIIFKICIPASSITSSLSYKGIVDVCRFHLLITA